MSSFENTLQDLSRQCYMHSVKILAKILLKRFLAYLNRWAHSIGRLRRPPFSKIFSKTAGLVKAKFFIWRLSGMGNESLFAGSWSKSKMSATTIYGKSR